MLLTASVVRVSDHLHKLSAGSCVITKYPKHAACHHLDVGFIDTASSHALVLALDDNGNSARLQYLVNTIGNLCGQLLLNLQSFRVGLDNSNQLTNTDDFRAWNIGNMRLTNDRCYVVLTVG